MIILDNVAVADAFPNENAQQPSAIMFPAIKSNGGYFQITNNPVYLELAYGIAPGEFGYGQTRWTQQIPFPTGPGILQPGTVGVRFKNYTPGKIANVSGALAENAEPAIEVTSSGIATSTSKTVLALLSDTSTVTLVNSVAEVTLIDFLIAANSLPANGLAKLTVMGTMINNTGANQGINLRSRFGSGSPVPLVTDTGGLNWVSGGGATVPWSAEVLIGAKGATNSQIFQCRYKIGTFSSAGVTGIGAFNTGTANVNSESVNSYMAASPAIDMTIDEHVALTFQFNAASPNLSITKNYALLEIYSP